MPAEDARLFAAVPTPLHEALNVDIERLTALCLRLIAEGCDGVAVFGTTGEGPSFSVPERIAVLDAILAAGVDPARVIVGTGCSALPDTITLTRHAAAAGCRGQLVLPPFFFGGPSEEGVFRAYAEVIEGCAADEPQILLYHIPAVSGVPVTVQTAQRLATEFPEQVIAVKDSSGDWTHTAPLIAQRGRLDIFVGNEPDIARARMAGARGTICGLANVMPGLLRRLCDDPMGPDAAAWHETVVTLATSFDRYPVIPAVKALVAAQTKDDGWMRVRPPLVVLGAEESRDIAERLGSVGPAS